MQEKVNITATKGLSKNILDKSITTREIIFFILFAVSLSPIASPPTALLMGLVIGLLVGHPYIHLNHKATHLLLQISVVGLGFGMSVTSAMQAGKQGILFTIASISGTLILGFLFSKFLKIEKRTSYLISAGTAICGGSAIAAIAPVIKAKEKEISVALGIVFILNSVALFIYPAVGHALNLSQTQFGLWCAIAIHDTSSVVGAASKYGTKALEVATTLKLARALWIIPVAFFSTFIFKNKKQKIKIPYFIGLFVLAMLVNSYIPFIQSISRYITEISKAGLRLTLFLIGCGLNISLIKKVGVKPFIQGILLWVIISITALWAITSII